MNDIPFLLVHNITDLLQGDLLIKLKFASFI